MQPFWVAALTVRNLDEAVACCLETQLRLGGPLMEEEVRTILHEALSRGGPKSGGPSGQGFGQRIYAHFAVLGGDHGHE